MNQNSAFDWLQSELGTPQADIEQNAEMIEAARMAALEQATMIKRALVDSDAGAMLLDFMTEKTIMTPMMKVSGNMIAGDVSMSPAEWAYVRAGQNSVIHFLRDQIALAMQPNQTGEQNDG